VFVGLGAGLLGLVQVLDATPLSGDELVGAGHVLLAVLVLAFTQGFPRAADRVAAHVYRVADATDLASRIETYRSGVRQAMNEGRSLSSDPELERVRETLDLDCRTQCA